MVHPGIGVTFVRLIVAHKGEIFKMGASYEMDQRELVDLEELKESRRLLICFEDFYIFH